MWAVSCAQTLAYARRKAIVSSALFARIRFDEYVTSPGCSIAPPPFGTARWSSFSYGYGMSKYASS